MRNEKMERIINIEDSVIKHSHQDTVSHILVVHQWQVCLMHNLIRVWFSNSFLLPSSQCEAYSLHWYKHQCCFVRDYILQILFSSYLISLSIINYKNQKHFNQFTMSVLFCVILFYRFFLVSAAALRSTTVGSEPTSTGRCEPVGTEQRSTGPLVPLYFPLSEFVNLYGKI